MPFHPLRLTTLCFFIKPSTGLSEVVGPPESILLAFKKRGFGVGKYNGAGGKVEDGETIEEAAKRECMEENKATWSNKCHVFVVHAPHWSGVERESEEMAPIWFPIRDIPYDKMWEDDRVWLPEVLDGRKVHYDFTFDENGHLLHYHNSPPKRSSCGSWRQNKQY